MRERLIDLSERWFRLLQRLYPPAAAWRRSGNWGRDAELATRRLLRAPALVLGVVGTLAIGLGLFAVVYTVVQKIVIESMPSRPTSSLEYGPRCWPWGSPAACSCWC